MQKQKFDEIVSYFNKKVSEMEIETKYKMELLGMVTALGYAHEKETHDKHTETHACDLIDRKEAIARAVPLNLFGRETMIVSVSELENLLPAQPELIEKEAYIRGFEQGRTQGMIDSQCGKK